MLDNNVQHCCYIKEEKVVKEWIHSKSPRTFGLSSLLYCKDNIFVQTFLDIQQKTCKKILTLPQKQKKQRHERHNETC